MCGAGGQLFQEHVTTWENRRTALARSISAMDFQHLQVAFVDIRHIANARTQAFEEGRPAEGVSVVLSDPYLEARLQKIDRARLLAFKAGERWSDKLRRRSPFYKPSEMDILASEPPR
jgi:hypothetical protein